MSVINRNIVSSGRRVHLEGSITFRGMFGSYMDILVIQKELYHVLLNHGTPLFNSFVHEIVDVS